MSLNVFSMLEVMLPSAIKAKYKKAFKMKDDIEVPSTLLQKFDKHGYYYYKDAQKNNDIQLLMKLLKDDIVEERTILTQNITKKTKRAVRVIEGYHPDEVLAKLEKVIKQYDLYVTCLKNNIKQYF